ncbi:hypothetical protein [Sphingomonas sp.]|uniref:hypothetical protein n=1 Tax=Sphingomonas sp. TaxID=28214 RepID=UPI003CC63D28
MVVFWWTGKGYLTPVILLGTLIVFGLLLRIGGSLLHDEPAFWGVAWLVASGINWLTGRRVNALKLAAVRSDRLRHRLFYRARNKFMSLPLEVWSIPMALCGIVALESGVSRE